MATTISERNNRANIMVIDDAPANLRLLQEMLQRNGYRALCFPRGAIALHAAKKNPPDIVLLDITMPGMHGFEVCRHFKKDETLKKVPVLFISALGESNDKVKAFAVGGVDYVTKPFQAEEVLARVKTHLNLRSMQAELERYNLYLSELVQEKVQEISEAQMATIIALSKLAESRDDDTGCHIERTRDYCRLLAHQLLKKNHYADVINTTFVDNIYHAAPLHDIGKVGISDAILQKPGKLTPEEFGVMKTHSIIGARTLESAYAKYPNNAFLNMGKDIALSHHEKWDGSGYPEGLSGDRIPVSARIMALADVYDALRTRRCYKDSFTHEKSYTIILDGSGKHFDPVVVAAFTAIHEDFAEIEKKLGNQLSPSQPTMQT